MSKKDGCIHTENKGVLKIAQYENGGSGTLQFTGIQNQC